METVVPLSLERLAFYLECQQILPLQELDAETVLATAEWHVAAQGSAYAACVASAAEEWDLVDFVDFVAAGQEASCFVDVCVGGIVDSFASACAALASVDVVAAG